MIDFSDLGNLGLAISATVTVFTTTLGFTKVGVIVGALGLLWKGVCSAIDNYETKAGKFPTTQPAS